ncbi:MAG: efflux RND transporter permease subunit, partial [Gemmatimonadaceae bacterium]
MSILQSALRRPLTVVVLIISVLMGAVLAMVRMPRDIFPTLGIPTIYVAQPYGGMDPAQMEGFLTYYYEYHFLYITGIEHVESKSIQGAALIKLQFYPGTDMSQAISEVVSYVNRARAFMPPGTVPPFVTRFDAGSVPVGDLVFTSQTRTVGELQDMALNRVRPLFATLPGVSAPPPFGGSARAIVINLKPDRLRANNMSPDEVVAAVTAANLISPSGNMAIGDKYPMVPLNSVVKNIQNLADVPIRTAVFPTVFLRDVATVTDGSDIVTSYALVNGRRTVYVPVTKRSDASTLTVVNLVKQNLARFQSVLPSDVTVSYEFDQSPYVTGAIAGLTLEGVLGAVLTGIMVLLFLRDWRSATIVVITIPLSLLASLLALSLTGQTINLMTLGGLALAVGILVDMAVVVIENIHAHLARGKPVARAVADSGKEVALPLLVAMLCVLAVFVPSFSMQGAARALFVPLALAVGFAMAAAYLLASTFVPVIAVWLVRPHHAESITHASAPPRGFAALQERFGKLVGGVVSWSWLAVSGYLLVTVAVSVLLFRRLGTDIFPKVDAGQLQVRLRAPSGTQIAGTEADAHKTLDLISKAVGPQNVEITLAFVGVHGSAYPINFIYLWNGGPEEAVVQVQLKPGAPIRMDDLKERLRRTFASEMPDVSFSFEPSDIISRVMSFGSATPVEVAVSGSDLAADRAFAEKVRDKIRTIPALRDV